MKLLSAIVLLLLAGLGVAFFSKQMREDDTPLTEQMRRLFSEESKVKVRYAEPKKEKFQMPLTRGETMEISQHRRTASERGR